ncbi:hypothetical protein PSHT_16363 [Puccinia striiformis]|uniref:Uncharacterized protein n=1 Tax=Puccinia striiformis TaxID=27350 RepID=A0A2S4UA75_9BASI|nr:hypothetical protein PSHT_16363 [Puccinia striiformis]
MSSRGYDLFGRENPPAGYHTDSENYRIHGIGPEPVDPKPQIIRCITSFLVHFPKKGPRAGYTPVKPKEDFVIEITAGAITFDAFRKLVADECNKKRGGAGQLIRDACEVGSPAVEWKVGLKFRTAPQWNKTAKPTPKINDEAGFAAWVQVIIDHGKDETESSLQVIMENLAVAAKESQTDAALKAHNLAQNAARHANSSRRLGLSEHPDQATTAGKFDDRNVIANEILRIYKPNVNYDRKIPVFLHPSDPTRFILLTEATVQKWAQAIKEPGSLVTIFSPPNSFKYEQVSTTKRRRINDDHSPRGHSPPAEFDPSPVIEPNSALVADYIKFVKIPLDQQDNVIQILAERGVTHPKMLLSKTITPERMLGWGLIDGFVTQLCDNIARV